MGLRIIDSYQPHTLAMNQLESIADIEPVDVFMIGSKQKQDLWQSKIEQLTSSDIKYIGHTTGLSLSRMSYNPIQSSYDDEHGLLDNHRKNAKLVCIIDEFDNQTKKPTTKTMRAVKRFTKELPKNTLILGLEYDIYKDKTNIVAKAMILSDDFPINDFPINTYTMFKKTYLRQNVLDIVNDAHKRQDYNRIQYYDKLLETAIRHNYKVVDTEHILRKESEIEYFIESHIQTDKCISS